MRYCLCIMYIVYSCESDLMCTLISKPCCTQELETLKNCQNIPSYFIDQKLYYSDLFLDNNPIFQYQKRLENDHPLIEHYVPKGQVPRVNPTWTGEGGGGKSFICNALRGVPMNSKLLEFFTYHLNLSLKKKFRFHSNALRKLTTAKDKNLEIFSIEK